MDEEIRGIVQEGGKEAEPYFRSMPSVQAVS